MSDRLLEGDYYVTVTLPRERLLLVLGAATIAGGHATDNTLDAKLVALEDDFNHKMLNTATRREFALGLLVLARATKASIDAALPSPGDTNANDESPID